MNANTKQQHVTLSELPTFEHYGRGTHGLAFYLYAPSGASLKLWFSYKTPVAFALNGRRVVRVNDWSTTTGGHLAAIDGGDSVAKKARLESEAFERALADALAEFNGNNVSDFGPAVVRVLTEYRLGATRGAGRVSDGLARDGFRKIAQAARDAGVFTFADAEVS